VEGLIQHVLANIGNVMDAKLSWEIKTKSTGTNCLDFSAGPITDWIKLVMLLILCLSD
jgi:hypothetical protein